MELEPKEKTKERKNFTILIKDNGEQCTIQYFQYLLFIRTEHLSNISSNY